MPDRHPLDQLGRRERQIMDILHKAGRASAAEVQEALPEEVSNSTVRGMLRYLESKGYVAYEQDGARYIYFPVARSKDVSRSALRHLVDTFFGNSPSSAIATLLEMNSGPIDDDEYRRLSKLLKQARDAGKSE